MSRVKKRVRFVHLAEQRGIVLPRKATITVLAMTKRPFMTTGTTIAHI